MSHPLELLEAAVTRIAGTEAYTLITDPEMMSLLDPVEEGASSARDGLRALALTLGHSVSSEDDRDSASCDIVDDTPAALFILGTSVKALARTVKLLQRPAHRVFQAFSDAIATAASSSPGSMRDLERVWQLPEVRALLAAVDLCVIVSRLPTVLAARALDVATGAGQHWQRHEQQQSGWATGAVATTETRQTAARARLAQALQPLLLQEAPPLLSELADLALVAQKDARAAAYAQQQTAAVEFSAITVAATTTGVPKGEQLDDSTLFPGSDSCCSSGGAAAVPSASKPYDSAASLTGSLSGSAPRTSGIGPPNHHPSAVAAIFAELQETVVRDEQSNEAAYRALAGGARVLSTAAAELQALITRHDVLCVVRALLHCLSGVQGIALGDGSSSSSSGAGQPCLRLKVEHVWKEGLEGSSTRSLGQYSVAAQCILDQTRAVEQLTAACGKEFASARSASRAGPLMSLSYVLKAALEHCWGGVVVDAQHTKKTIDIWVPRTA